MFKINQYFDGKVASIAFQTATLPATVGVMAVGEFEFGTSQKETMTVVSGALTVKLPGSSEWKTYNAGDSLSWPRMKNSSSGWPRRPPTCAPTAERLVQQRRLAVGRAAP